MIRRFAPAMSNPLLYLSTILLWGSSWLVIKFQLGEVAPAVSVFYRFLIASVILIVYCLLKGDSLRYRPMDHLRFAFIGLFLFNLNYIAIYFATFHLTTGLISVIFSCVQIFNMLIGYFVMGERITAKMIAGACVGIAGIALVFAPEIEQLDWSDETFRGVGLALLGTLFAAIGMSTSAGLQRLGYPVLQTNALGMSWGAIGMLVFVVASGTTFTFEFSVPYIGGLVWLSLFSTVLGFGCFLTLVGRIGAARASYATVMFPIVALLLSTAFESYQWGLPSVTGMVLAIIGNIIIILDRNRQPTQPVRTPA